ncbi:MAG: hypothetical protein JXA44_02820 [Methanospirillaceae archaeon]|nr:hypothetical protein [Methanospirillaceae archaeon]
MRRGTGAMARISVILTLLFTVGLVLAGAPILPIEFHGPVTIDGNDASVGTTIVALSDNAERGRIVTTEPGYYGGTGTFDDRLKVILEEGDSTISFTINGREALQTWPPEGESLQPGTSGQLPLSVGGPPPTIVAPTVEPTAEPTPVATPEPVSEPTSVPTTEPTPVATPEPVSEPTAVPTTIPPTISPEEPETNATAMRGLMHFTEEQLRERDAVLATMPQADAYEGEPLPEASRSLLSYVPYTGPNRDQGNCGNCWVWASTGSIEIDHALKNQVSDRLSVQYFNSNYHNGTAEGNACNGGFASEFASFYTSVLRKAIPWSNKNAGYADYAWSGGPSGIPASLIATTPNYPLSGVAWQLLNTHNGQKEAISNIKSQINAQKPVYWVFTLPTSGWDSFHEFWDYYPDSTIWDPSPYVDQVNGGSHGVLIVGYDDTGETPYWEVLNSWGTTTKRPAGTFRVRMEIDYDAQMTTGEYTSYMHSFELLSATYSPTPTVTPTVSPTVTPTVTPTPDYGQPVLPETFYGTVHIYGLPASKGGTIEIRVPSMDKVLTAPIQNDGLFGAWSKFDDALSLQDIEDGTPIEFWVKDALFKYPAKAYVMVWGTDTYTETLPFQGGILSFLDLAVSDSPPPIPTTPPTPEPTPVPTSPPHPSGVPSIPHTFYGDVSVYGNDIQVGGTVEARVAGYDVSGPNNPYEITHVGSFGGNSTWEKKLTVQGTGVTDDSFVTFWVKDLGYQYPVQAFVRDDSKSADSWESSIPYQSGAISTVSLYVGNSPPTPTPTPYPTPTSGRLNLPQWFYGTVFLDGVMVPAGSEVKATVKGELYYNEQNPVIVAEAGYYGDDSASKDAKLKVWDVDINPGDSIEFYIKTEAYPWWIRALCKHPLAGKQYQEAWRYQPGSVTNLDLKASSSTPFEEVSTDIGPQTGILSP